MSQREYIMGEGPMVAVSCMGGRLAYVVTVYMLILEYVIF